MYEPDGRSPKGRRVHDVLLNVLNASPQATTDVVPLPLDPAIWRDVILQTPMSPAINAGLVSAILRDRRASLLYFGLASLDDETLAWLESERDTLLHARKHAAIFAAGGYSKEVMRQELFVMARVPHEKISDENLELLSKRRPVWFKNGAAREVGAVDRPEDVWVVVAGGAGAKSAYIPGRTGTCMQTVAVGRGGLE